MGKLNVVLFKLQRENEPVKGTRNNANISGISANHPGLHCFLNLD